MPLFQGLPWLQVSFRGTCTCMKLAYYYYKDVISNDVIDSIFVLQGTFPYVAFFITSVGGTVVAIAIYWSLRISEKVLGKRKRVSVTLTHNKTENNN